MLARPQVYVEHLIGVAVFESFYPIVYKRERKVGWKLKIKKRYVDVSKQGGIEKET